MDENRSKMDPISKENKSSFQWRDLFRIAVTFFLTFVCCTIFFFIFLRFSEFKEVSGEMIHSAGPILIGLMLAYIMNPIMKKIDKLVYKLVEKSFSDKAKAHKLSRAVGIAGTTILLLMSLMLIIALVLPALVNSITHFVYAMPRYVRSIQYFIENGRFGDAKITELLGDYIEEGAKILQKWFEDNVIKEARTYISQITNGVISVVKGVLNFIIGIIVMDYVMAIQGTLAGQFKKLVYAIFRPKQGNIIVDTIRRASRIFGGFITGKLIDSAIIAVIAYFGCKILRIPDAILVATIIGITNIIPFFGPFIGAVPSLLIVVIQSPWHALYLLIFIIVLQQVDGNIIGPNILGSSTGMSSFWIMVAILVSGGVFGIAGMIFGVPLFALIGYIINSIIDTRLKKKKLPTELERYEDLKKIDTITNAIVEKHSSESKNS